MKNQVFRRRLGYARAGIAQALKRENSVKTQAVLAVVAILALLILRPALVWWALVGVMIVLVLAAELFNTAIEEVCDLVHPRPDPRVKLIKDVAAGAVLLLSVGALWVAVLMVLSVMG